MQTDVSHGELQPGDEVQADFTHDDGGYEDVVVLEIVQPQKTYRVRSVKNKAARPRIVHVKDVAISKVFNTCFFIFFEVSLYSFTPLLESCTSD